MIEINVSIINLIYNIFFKACNLDLNLNSKIEDVEMRSENSEQGFKMDKVFIIDHIFALNQIDILENCNILSNLVIPDTVLRYLNRKNIQAFHGLRNTMELETQSHSPW